MLHTRFASIPRLWSITLCLVVVAAALGCGAPPETTEASAAEPAAPAQAATAELLGEALSHPDRPEDDRNDDANRKPDEVLAFFGIEPGMKVLDLLAGGGYYTELLARLTGEGGEVLFHNNEGYAGFLGEALDQRLANDRLPNVRPIRSELDGLELEAGSLDAAIFILGFHDTYWEPEDGSWPKVDRERLLAEIYEALVPGGTFGIVDHAAQPGGDTTAVVNDLHRIDEAVVRADLEAAGFVLDGESDLLRNPEDSKDVGVFDESIRRRTDRFVLRYQKPS